MEAMQASRETQKRLRFQSGRVGDPRMMDSKHKERPPAPLRRAS